ncbi:MAG: outer membrane protein assembly factor BamB [Legionella sp.]|nr:MAG: outer membrane protein assembly factor BamB [Legionella sp.]
MRFSLKKVTLLLLCGFGLHACSMIDDYILGKDNTIQPKPLADIQSKVQFHKSWSTSIGQPNRSHTYYKLKPVVLGKTIYTADASGKISAVSSKGQIIWTTPLKQHAVSGPSVGHGFVIVGTNSGTLVALSQKDGHVVWEQQMSEDALSKSAITEHAVIAKTIDGHLYAFDLTTGKQLWSVDHGSPNLILKASSSPKIMGNLVLVGYSDGKLDAVDLETGRMVWQRSIAYANGASDVERLVDIDADPIIRDHWVYLASYQGYIGALNLEDGQFAWSKRASVYKNMLVDRDTLYVTDSNDVIWAYGLHSGQIKWKQMALRGYGVTEPILIGSRLMVGDKSGQLHALSISSGELIGRERIGSAINISPTQFEDKIIVMLANGELQAYQIKAKS